MVIPSLSHSSLVPRPTSLVEQAEEVKSLMVSVSAVASPSRVGVVEVFDGLTGEMFNRVGGEAGPIGRDGVGELIEMSVITFFE